MSPPTHNQTNSPTTLTTPVLSLPVLKANPGDLHLCSRKRKSPYHGGFRRPCPHGFFVALLTTGSDSPFRNGPGKKPAHVQREAPPQTATEPAHSNSPVSISLQRPAEAKKGRRIGEEETRRQRSIPGRGLGLLTHWVDDGSVRGSYVSYL